MYFPGVCTKCTFFFPFLCNSENIPLKAVSSFPLTFGIKSSTSLHGWENSNNSHWQEQKEQGSVGGEEMKEWVIFNSENYVCLPPKVKV